MKITLRKTVECTFDTTVERKRIANAFKDQKDVQDKLYKLMDLVEREKWEEAYEELHGEWWDGRDTRQECPRLEFVGMLKHDSHFFDIWATYLDLILNMRDYPDVYKIVSKTV